LTRARTTRRRAGSKSSRPSSRTTWTTEGQPDFTYHFYGVHSGARDGVLQAVTQGRVQDHAPITQIMKPGWGPDEKPTPRRCTAARNAGLPRNILGEAGGAGSAFFVTARLMACIDQDRESDYNTIEFKRQKLDVEELDAMLGEIPDTRERDAEMYELLTQLIDVPTTSASRSTSAATSASSTTRPSSRCGPSGRHKRKSRLKLVRMFHLWRFREKQIRQVLYVIGWKLRPAAPGRRPGRHRPRPADLPGHGGRRGGPAAPPRRDARLRLQRQGAHRRRPVARHQDSSGQPARPPTATWWRWEEDPFTGHQACTS
jgi:hypothetical protein